MSVDTVTQIPSWKRQWRMLRSQHIDGFLFIHRSAIAWVIIGAIIFVIVCLVATLVGFAWKPDPFAPFGVSEEVTALLAVGTLALGFAALVQAVSRLETADSALRPNLVLEWKENEVGKRLVNGAGLVIQNVGPAVAKSVRCALITYQTPKEAWSHFREKVPGTTMSRVVIYGQSALIRGASFGWDTHLTPKEPAVLNAVLEIRARTVFDRPSAIRAYLMQGKSMTGHDRTVSPNVWNEWEVLDQDTWQIWEVPEKDPAPFPEPAGSITNSNP